MLVHTTWSTYEIDLDRKRVRRLEGVNPPTPRQSIDHIWQDYVGVLIVGDGIYFIWEGTFWDARGTYTSAVQPEDLEAFRVALQEVES